jgi:hypothetical protein
MVVVIGQIYGVRACSATRFARPPYRQMRLVGARETAWFGPVIKRSSMLFAENTVRCPDRLEPDSPRSAGANRAGRAI